MLLLRLIEVFTQRVIYFVYFNFLAQTRLFCIFSVLWHPSGENTDIITLSDNHIIRWNVEDGSTSARVSISSCQVPLSRSPKTRRLDGIVSCLASPTAH